MKILVFIEHDIIVRHFLQAGAFSALAARHDVAFVFPEEGHRRVTSDVASLELGGRKLRLPTMPARRQLWRWLFLVDILRWRPGRHHQALRRFRRAMIGRKASLWLSTMALPGIRPLFRRRVLRRLDAMPNAALERLLDGERPDVLIHPSVLDGVYLDDLVEASRRRRTPLVVVMNSWDNPSTKRSAVAPPDWLLVWGPQTHEHAVRFMGMSPERVIEFGAAQFDLFRNPPRIDRTEFCRRHEIPSAARILLYAGSSKGAAEFDHLCALDEAIEDGRLSNVVVVYRPHPWGDGGAGGERIIDHPWRHVRIETSMRGYLEGVKAGRRGITTPDYRDTHDVLSAVDVVISPLSTILIEAALHGKPPLCFLPDEDPEHLRYSMPMVHFEDFFADPCFNVTRGTGALIGAAAALLDQAGKPGIAERCRAAAKRFVTSFDESYPQRLATFVETIIRHDEEKPADMTEPTILSRQACPGPVRRAASR